ncbi:SpoIID/LytB domain-containing protein [Entomospira culicis]|uniref:SpoIID/LytB domain-containing protein n=1 Tax=Entomospira culicis TaxID=2719989 RepID=A0A968GG95_9SPIO|nr:SpoIID/LytB domain-containing protein [Entomospira culicis]NIZ19587.1 SpoIID/LytB domain-containing protein [Entomospira culicis]NIZ69508.1 SpoIID/LytB domain-containing protein [Entomospira culicis]WDI36623.1 SpoIID/LytB domain-containing protein [Entomospira culicis]WDI38251.1 SpoIID/LytB domain-containing protein [Entomospira culicis]
MLRHRLLLILITFFGFTLSAQQQKPPKASQKRSVSEREFKKAVQAFYLGGMESAIDIHKKNIQKDPLFFDSYFELTALLKEQSRNQEAVEVVAQLYAYHPKPQEIVDLYFITLVQAGKIEQAKEIEQQLIQPVKTDRTRFYQGFLAYRQKNFDLAIQHFEETLNINGFFAGAAFFLAKMHQEKGDHAKAIETFQRTLRIEPNFTSAYYPMALSQLALEQTQSALTSLRRARNLMPRSQRLNNKIAEIEAILPPAKPVDNTTAIKDNRQKNVQVPAIKTFSPIVDNPIPIRIGLVEDIRELQIKTGGAYQLHSKQQLLHTSAESEVLSIKATVQGVAIYDRQQTLIAQSSNPIHLSYPDEQLATAVFDIINGAGYYFSSVVTRYYRGDLEFMPRPNQRLTLVNELNLEDYLYSVVPSEMPASWPEEALKAQAVAARTYALATMGGFKDRGFDLLSSVASQAYTGMAGEHVRSTHAVNATAGMVLYSKITKKLLVTYYSANHGGYSEDGHLVWTHAVKNEHLAVADRKEDNKRKEPLPLFQLNQWLHSRPQTHSNWPRMHSSFAFRSAVWIDNDDLQARIARTQEIGTVHRLTTRLRGIGGRASLIEATGSNASVEIRGDIIRSRFGGLRSNLFTLESIYTDNDYPEYFIFTTAGWGHGVGLDQSGSAGMAADGYTWQEILHHYYPNGKIQRYKP